MSLLQNPWIKLFLISLQNKQTITANRLMYFTRLTSIIGLSSFVFIYLNCSVEPIQTDLSNINQSIDTLTINNITGFTYQVSPEISSYQKLYIGSENNFSFPSSLLKFSSDVWDTFLDSSVTVDSAFFRVYSGDSLLNADINLNLHFSQDSVFSEENSHVDQLDELDFSMWASLGFPKIHVVSDTSDTISHFQETVLSWELSDIINTLADTMISHRTFSLSFPDDSDSSFIEIYSREYSSGSLDPKIEIYYRSIISSNEEESIIDTLTRIIYVGEDISTITNAQLIESLENSILLSRGRGYRSIINIPFDSLSLPQFSIIRYANLLLYQSDDSLDNYSVRMEPLKQNIDTLGIHFDSDPYENLNMHYSSANTSGGKIQISLKSHFQSILMVDSLKNAGMKLYSGVTNSVFDSIKFDLDNENNRVEILYVSP